MPIIDVEGQQFEFPEGTDDTVIGESIRAHFSVQAEPEIVPRETIDDQAQPEEMSAAGQAILEMPGGAAITEFTSAVNRGAVNILDFIGPDQINNVLQLIGSESRVPTLKEQPIVQEAITGEFMEPGLTRQAVRTAGEFVAPGSAVGATIRGAAAQIPKVAPVAQTVAQRVTQAATAPSLPTATGAAMAGAGTEVGAEVGEAVAGEKGRPIGRLAGGILFPIGGAIVKETGKQLVSQSAKTLLKQAAPTIEGLKQAARGVYKEIDDLGVTINPSATRKLAVGLRSKLREKGYSPGIHKDVKSALKEFDDVAGKPQTTGELDRLRRVAQAAAGSIKPDEARLGNIMVSRIDDFLDNLNKANFSGAFKKDVGAKYRDARQLWRRVKKSEQLEEAWKNAELAAPGFERGIRDQFRSILKSAKKRKGFTKEELKAMRGVVEGNTIRNLAEKIGMLGIDERKVSGALMPLMGAAGGAFAYSGPGALAVPIIGTVSKKLGLRLAKDAGRGADLVVRAGKNGADIVKAYMKITPAKARDAKELTELLLRPDINLKGLQKAASIAPEAKKRIINDAVFLVNTIKAAQEEER